MKEWAGAIVLFVIVCALAVAFVKYGVPYIERSMSAVQSHKASL